MGQKMKSSLSDVIHLIVLECFLLSVCLIGDHILFTCQDSVIKAVSDNLTHASVGLISWIIIIFRSSMSIISNVKTNCSWILAAGLLSSLIDLDHFVAAHSLHLDNATHLTSRPLLHCSLIPLIFLLLSLTLGRLFNNNLIETGFLNILLFVFSSSER